MTEIPDPLGNQIYIDNVECHIARRNNQEERWLEYRCNPIHSGLYKGGHVEYFYDITKRKNAEDIIKNSRKRVRNLANNLQIIREKERKFIANELHDEFGQALTGIKIDLSILRNKFQLNSGEKKFKDILDHIDTIIKNVNETIDEVKRILFKIRSAFFEDMGLIAAISTLLKEFKERTKITMSVNIDIHDIDINKERDLVVFRILQEALTNIARHANADNVTVDLYNNGK